MIEDMRQFITEHEAREKAREAQNKIDNAFRSEVRELEGRIDFFSVSLGHNECADVMDVKLTIPENFWKSNLQGYSIKKGIKDQFNGKKVTVIIHD